MANSWLAPFNRIIGVQVISWLSVMDLFQHCPHVPSGVLGSHVKNKTTTKKLEKQSFHCWLQKWALQCFHTWWWATSIFNMLFVTVCDPQETFVLITLAKYSNWISCVSTSCAWRVEKTLPTGCVLKVCRYYCQIIKYSVTQVIVAKYSSYFEPH